MRTLARSHTGRFNYREALPSHCLQMMLLYILLAGPRLRSADGHTDVKKYKWGVETITFFNVTESFIISSSILKINHKGSVILSEAAAVDCKILKGTPNNFLLLPWGPQVYC